MKPFIIFAVALTLLLAAANTEARRLDVSMPTSAVSVQWIGDTLKNNSPDTFRVFIPYFAQTDQIGLYAYVDSIHTSNGCSLQFRYRMLPDLYAHIRLADDTSYYRYRVAGATHDSLDANGVPVYDSTYTWHRPRIVDTLDVLLDTVMVGSQMNNIAWRKTTGNIADTVIVLPSTYLASGVRHHGALWTSYVTTSRLSSDDDALSPNPGRMLEIVGGSIYNTDTTFFALGVFMQNK
jgi:hypothetical protein